MNFSIDETAKFYAKKTNSKQQMDGHVVSLFLGEILHPDADVSDWL